MKISKAAFDLITHFEGLDTPGEWPGGASGVSIGRGFDLGYEKDFDSIWGKYLTQDIMKELRKTVGLTGNAARRAAATLGHIKIPVAAADAVFKEHTVPVEEAKTIKAFPGSENLNPDAFGALVSLVFNRGALVDKTSRRREMLAIRTKLANNPKNPNHPVVLEYIADQLEAMCRLWPNVRGLRRRRIAEAALVRASAKAD